MITKCTILLACIILTSCGNGNKNLESILSEIDGEYLEIEGHIVSVHANPMAPKYQLGFVYPQAVIQEFPEGSLLVVGHSAWFTVQLTNVKVENNSLGFPNLDELKLQIHSPSRTFMTAESPIGQKVKLRLYYNLEEDGTIRFNYTIRVKM